MNAIKFEYDAPDDVLAECMRDLVEGLYKSCYFSVERWSEVKVLMGVNVQDVLNPTVFMEWREKE